MKNIVTVSGVWGRSSVCCIVLFVFQGAMFDENNEKAFYDSDSEEKRGQTEAKPYIMDPDHRLLLRNTKPLLQSRNTAVSKSLKHRHIQLSSRSRINTHL